MLKIWDIALLWRKKDISSNPVDTITQAILEEIQTLKEQLKSVNIVQDVPSQTRNSYQNQQNNVLRQGMLGSPTV